MRPHSLILASALLCASLHHPLHAQELPAAITTDPAPDKANPAAMETFQIPSHGAMLNALAYIGEGAGPHPVVLLLHGFPGNEKNLDLAQAIRRDGWDVVYFDDGLAPSNDAFVAALHKAAATDITTVHLTTDYSYSDQRIALEKAVLEALEFLQHK
jgi:pimeloyl-ACP methyl ester carboxylesterase